MTDIEKRAEACNAEDSARGYEWIELMREEWGQLREPAMTEAVAHDAFMAGIGYERLRQANRAKEQKDAGAREERERIRKILLEGELLMEIVMPETKKEYGVRLLHRAWEEISGKPQAPEKEGER